MSRRLILCAALTAVCTLIAVSCGADPEQVATADPTTKPTTTTTSSTSTSTTTSTTSTTVPPTTQAPTTTAVPEPPPPAPPAPTAPPATEAPVEVSGSSRWDQLAQCETGGNWAHPPVGSYGYSGGLMFLPSTWTSYGGAEFASAAHHATREQQIVVAERVLADVGWGAWPGCSRKFGWL